MPKAMALNPMEEKDEHSITVEREEIMIPPTGGVPILRKAHFLKPFLNPINQPLPKFPSFSVSSNPNIHEIKKRVCFKWCFKPQKSWKIWVDDMQKTHEAIWKKVGIFDAIRASTYCIKKDNELIIVLGDKWCSETDTFIFPWGESTITLEDVMILGGFSVLGVSVLSKSQNRTLEDIETELAVACYNVKKNCGRTLKQSGWMKYFKGRGGELEHVAFLILWLSRYVFPTHSYNINQNVFPIAISLAKGTKIALAPAILASIYRDLALLKQNIVASIDKGRDDGSNLVLWAPFQLVQIWAWERFPISLGPKPATLVQGEPRLARWHSGKPRLDMEFGGYEFLWRPYGRYLENWEFPKFYSDQEMRVLVNSEVDDEELWSFARCLMPCELVGMDCLVQYQPHRVARQFGYDQGLPVFIPRSNDDYNRAWNSYDKPCDGLKFYLPPRLVEGDVTVQYAKWWKAMLSLHDEALKVYERRKRTQRKMKKMSQLLHGPKEGNSKGTTTPPSFRPPLVGTTWENVTEKLPSFEVMAPQDPLHVVNESGAHSGVNPVTGIEDTQHSQHIAKEGGKGKEVEGNDMSVDNRNKHSLGSLSPPLVDSIQEKAIGRSAFFDAIAPQNPPLVVDKKGLVSVVNAIIEIERIQEYEHTTTKEEDKEKEVEGKTNIDNGSKHSLGNHSQSDSSPTNNENVSVTQAVTGPDMKKLCCTNAEDERDKAAEDAIVKQVNNSADDVVVIDDDEEENNDIDDPFEALVCGFDARITRLESVVSTLKATKFRS